MIGSGVTFGRLLSRAAIIAAILVQVPSLCAQQAAPSDTPSAGVISGRVLTTDGAPISDARVAVTRMGAASLSQTRPRVDGNGGFKTDVLEPGLYYVSAGAAGYVSDPPPQGSPAYYHPGDSVTLTMIKG